MNTELASSIVCELSYAVTLAIKNDREEAEDRSNHKLYGSFLYDWGVEVATDFTVSENTTINPTTAWLPLSQFSLAGGISKGAVATNVNTFNVFYPLSALYKPDIFKTDTKERPCRQPAGHQEGSPLVDIDLRILPLLESRIQTVQLHIADAPDKKEVIKGGKNVLQQTVSIKETISGDITPTWKFTTSTVNASGKLFSAGRERTHKIVFTFAQLADDKQTLSPLGEAWHINEQKKVGIIVQQ
ncbi:hypothetical protein Mesau_00575 [Mesorhizobium australicum WSM2073]|uniref:Uncharacterized protein n=2 Tax=Mesorhizobium australicum TaxID=536018 RepID=L0KFA6_MESAW|nr:hypothetical protein Mesau_00575 [Mesorhizobium australicum WSM2073]